ncbi:MAG TPA: sec-independent translocase [Actinomycetes bacterium]
MLDIGAGEFIGLAVIAMIVLGPEKLPRYAAEAARVLRRVRQVADDARADVRRELGPEFDDVSLRDLNPRAMVRKHLLDPIDLDSLDTPERNGSRTKPAARRGPGEPPSGSSSAAPPPYDPDAT